MVPGGISENQQEAWERASPQVSQAVGKAGTLISQVISYSLQELPCICAWPSCSKTISLESPEASKGEAPASPKVAGELILCFGQAVGRLRGANSHVLVCHTQVRARRGTMTSWAEHG